MEPRSTPSAHPGTDHRPSLEVAEIFRAHGKAYRSTHGLSLEQLQAMQDIEQCRTALMGGHVDVCEKECGHFLISCNSCRNRHCPKCQALSALRWLDRRIERLLPTPYFHMVSTLPHEFNPLVLYNKELMYTAIDSILDF
jgi:hypothetical protein